MRTWLCCLLAIALGCGGKKEDRPAVASGSAPAAIGDAVPAGPPAALEIFVDDKSVAKVTSEQLAKWPRLDTLVPEDDRRLGTWQMVRLRSSEPAPIEVARPSASYPQMVPAIFPGDGGVPAFGMFDPVALAKHGKPALRHDAIKEIRIEVAREGRGGEHQGGAGGTDDPLKLVLTFKLKTGDKQLTGEQIVALPRESQPGSEDTKGWRLAQLLAAAGVTKYSKLALIDAGGTSLILDKAELDDKNVVPFVKLNRQGSLRFRLLKKQGTGWQAAGDLRALATIKVD
ncbi:MAG TPA: hypothetical protein VFQ53_22465 [Kofleriaceae bacterium]|nr:hypothetical protein [Kofleriaceae bacterium]